MLNYSSVFFQRLTSWSAVSDPRLFSLKNVEISISHTRAWAAAIISDAKVGTDIQVRVDKIDRIAHKFMSSREMENINPLRKISFYHVYWGAKECLYKAYGRRKLDFKNHILIHPFNLEAQITTNVCTCKFSIYINRGSAIYAFEIQDEFFICTKFR